MSTRREFLTAALAGGAAAALGPWRASAAPKSMAVVHESSFIKGFDDFFVKTLSPEYEKLTGIKVGYEPVSVGSMLTRLTTIVETKSGPEIVATGVNWPHLFDQGLLDVTDNVIDGRVVHPAGLRIFDEEDPYLVVAADKGTARFSDEANAIAAEYGHWLGDAFASGGSHGYDHKALGITARGAWECVRTRFREMDVDADTAALRVFDERRGVVKAHRLVVEERRVERGRIMHLQICAGIGQQRKARRVRFGEAVERKRGDRGDDPLLLPDRRLPRDPGIRYQSALGVARWRDCARCRRGARRGSRPGPAGTL